MLKMPNGFSQILVEVIQKEIYFSIKFVKIMIHGKKKKIPTKTLEL